MGWLERRGTRKLVTRGGLPYLERTYLLRAPALAELDLPEALFLHTFYQDDPDSLHDHPWDWGRLILRGRYQERTFVGDGNDTQVQSYGPGHILWRRPATTSHRVEILTPSVTTLFWHWTRRWRWGFWDLGSWTPAPNADTRPMEGFILPRKKGPAPSEASRLTRRIR